jgi:hypothetical protein
MLFMMCVESIKRGCRNLVGDNNSNNNVLILSFCLTILRYKYEMSCISANRIPTYSTTIPMSIKTTNTLI